MKKLITIALAVVMIFTMVVSVAAEEFDSPQPKEVYSVTVTYSPADGSMGDASSDKNQVIIDDPTDEGHVTLTAVPKNGSKFIKWNISGEYEIIEGSLTTPKLVIKPSSDIKAEATFSDSETPTTSPSSKPASTPSSPSSGTSPKTGDPLYLIIALAVLALGTGAFAIKKIKE